MYVSGSDHLDVALKAQGAAMVALTSVAFGCFQKMTEVNLKAAKAAFVGQQGVAAALAANDPLARRLQSSLIQPATESALAYTRQIQEIVAAAQVEFQQVIDADHEQNGRRAQDYVAHVVKHLPACADAVEPDLHGPRRL
ncbi:phasin family protein [Cupriavidus sp. AcVe19-1a]|uniref:phasin family protein n=1 Tax=Cupriavidus sp. AcVe19-1a TaxID=2821359 RepID=UPI0032AF1915